MSIFCLLPNEGDSNKQVKISVKFKKILWCKQIRIIWVKKVEEEEENEGGRCGVKEGGGDGGEKEIEEEAEEMEES